MTKDLNGEKPREFWLYERGQNTSRRNFSYVREAIGEYKDSYELPSSPWLRKMPPTKLIEYAYAKKLERQISFLKSCIKSGENQSDEDIENAYAEAAKKRGW